MGGPASPQERQPAATGRQRLLGMILLGTGVLGILLSLMGLVAVAVVGSAAETALLRELETLDRTLAISGDGLGVTEEALGDAQTLIEGISLTVGQATTAITSTQPTLSALEDLTGKSLPETITNTRQALDSAQATARIMDQVLGALAILGVNYNPEVPLNEAIGRVSTSLAAVPAELEEVSTGIGASNEQVTTVAGDLTDVADDLDALGARIGEATAVVKQYQTLAAGLRDEVAAVKSAAPGWILLARIGLTLLLIWMGLAQIGLITQGLERMRWDGTGLER